MKRVVSTALSLAMIASLTACSSSSASTAATAAADASAASGSAASAAQPTVGVMWYNFSDTFISNARQCLDNIAAKDGTFKVTDADTQADTTVQDNNMSNFFTQNVNYLVINNYNFAATSQIVATCKSKDVTTIFANTSSPSDDDFKSFDKLWYVSSASEQSGQNEGEELVDYLNANKDTWDRNGNGKVDYILLEGSTTFSDTINRTSYSLAAIEAAGYTLGTNIGGQDVTGVKGGDFVQGVVCNFDRSQAQSNVEALLGNYGNDIDLIIADNDDEALGAIAALQAHGYLVDKGDGTFDKYIPIVGVDATAAGCEAVKAGTLLGTSLNNPVTLSKSIYKLLTLLNAGKDVSTESMGLDGVTVTGHKVIISYKKITKDNLADATYDIKDTNF